MNAKQAIDRVFESDSGNTPNFWKIDPRPADQSLRFDCKSVDSAKPRYDVRPQGVTTKSGIVVGFDFIDQVLSGDPFGEKEVSAFIPNDLFMKIKRLSDDYTHGYVHGRNGQQTVDFLTSIEKEILKAKTDYHNPGEARAQQAEQRRKDHEKAQGLENRKNLHRAHQRHQASRSPMDYAGGSQDVQGKDYTTQESLK
jgi:hypothetical protein